jgi:hypothetical protein
MSWQDGSRRLLLRVDRRPPAQGRGANLNLWLSCQWISSGNPADFGKTKPKSQMFSIGAISLWPWRGVLSQGRAPKVCAQLKAGDFGEQAPSQSPDKRPI